MLLWRFENHRISNANINVGCARLHSFRRGWAARAQGYIASPVPPQYPKRVKRANSYLFYFVLSKMYAYAKICAFGLSQYYYTNLLYKEHHFL